jgi:hypothetical protein
MVSAVIGRDGFTRISAINCANGLYSNLGSVVRLHSRETAMFTLSLASNDCQGKWVISCMTLISFILTRTCILAVQSAAQLRSSSVVAESDSLDASRAFPKRFFHAEPPSSANGETTLNIRCENRDLTRFSSRRGVSFEDHRISSVRKYRRNMQSAPYDSAGHTDNGDSTSRALDRPCPDALHDVHYRHQAGR